MKRLLTIVICIVHFSTTGNTQPNLTLWRVFSEDHDVNATAPEFYACGSSYYFNAQSDNDVIEGIWSIKNEGADDLVLDLPLLLTTDFPQNFKITKQPNKGTLATGEETHFKIQFTESLNHGNSFLSINSNDPLKSSCGLLVDGGISCSCVCDSNGKIHDPCFGRGALSGIIIYNGTCTDGNLTVDEPCSTMSLSDPCNCNNLVTISGIQYYQDTLTISTVPLISYSLTENNITASTDTSFLDNTGSPYTVIPTTTMGPADVNGIIKFPFLRRPETGVSIRVEGVPFRSAACPSLSTCKTSTIPTLSEWGIIILSILLMLFSIVAVRQKTTSLS